MFVEVNIDFSSDGGWRKIAEQKGDFWKRILAAGQDREYSSKDEISLRDIDQAEESERRFRIAFPQELEGHINAELQRAWGPSATKGRRRAPEVKLRLVSVEYGSLKAVLDIIGIDSKEFPDFVLSILTIYSPIAFRTALGTNITTSASVKVVGEDLRLPENILAPATRGMQALDRVWLISNTSLLVPVGLGLLILYFAFSALTHEMEGVRSQIALAQAERAEVLRALAAQNAKASDLLAAHANGLDDPIVKVLTEVLLAQSRSNTGNAGGTNRPFTRGASPPRPLQTGR